MKTPYRLYTGIAGVALAVAGCAGVGPEPAISSVNGRQLERAPSVAELEQPLAANGNGHATARQVPREALPPFVDEAVTVDTRDVYGDAFPGLNADRSRVVTPQGEAPATRPADPDLLARLRTLEGRVDEALATQQTTPERIAALENRLAELRATQATPPQDLEAAVAQRLARMEERLAEVETAPAPPATAGGLEAQLAALEQRVEAVEAQPAPVIEVDDATLQREVARLEQRIAELEAQPAPEMPDNSAEVARLAQRIAELEAQPAPATPDNSAEVARLAQRIAELEAQPAPEMPDNSAEIARVEQRIADIESQPVPAAPASIDTVERLEARLAALEDRPPREVTFVPDGLDATLGTLEAQVAQLDTQLRGLESQIAARAEAEAPYTRPEAGGLTQLAYAGPHGEAYVLGSGDALSFFCYDDETLNTDVTVRYDGRISLPLIPEVRVASHTRAEAEAMLRDAYATVFRDPQLSLVVREAASKTFTVYGDVSEPSVFAYTQPINLLQAITQAGGLRERNAGSSVGGFVGITGQLTRAFVVRTVEGERRVYDYDLRQLGKPGAHASEAPIFPGDLVYVPEGVNLVYVLGESRNPVIVELTEDMTVLQLLALSGGFNASTARLRSVVLIRQTGEEQSTVMTLNVRRMLRTGEDVRLQPADIVYIPRKYLVRIQEFVARLTGSIAPVINLYTDAVDAYYARDLAEEILNADQQSNTLRVLNEIEAFGSTTGNIVDLFGPTP